MLSMGLGLSGVEFYYGKEKGFSSLETSIQPLYKRSSRNDLTCSK